ncbi:unnamed protein product, partial [Polarella glacialis]
VDLVGGGVKVGVVAATRCTEEGLEKEKRSKRGMCWGRDPWIEYATPNAEKRLPGGCLVAMQRAKSAGSLGTHRPAPPLPLSQLGQQLPKPRSVAPWTPWAQKSPKSVTDASHQKLPRPKTLAGVLVAKVLPSRLRRA